jgi:hypothetical protein
MNPTLKISQKNWTIGQPPLQKQKYNHQEKPMIQAKSIPRYSVTR